MLFNKQSFLTSFTEKQLKTQPFYLYLLFCDILQQTQLRNEPQITKNQAAALPHIRFEETFTFPHRLEM